MSLLLITTISCIAIGILTHWLTESRAGNAASGWGNLTTNTSNFTNPKILIWNMKFLPWPVTTDSIERATLMLMESIWDNVDIVVLTEIINGDAAEIVANCLKTKGFVWGTRPLQSWPRLNGGVLIASRIQPINTTYIIFEQSTYKEADRFASKGAILVEWASFSIVGTHLDACPKDSETRQHQIEQIRKLCLPLIKPVFWAGDFNFDLRYEAHLYNLIPYPSNAIPTFEYKRLDGILFPTKSKNIWIEDKVLNLIGSDHFPVLATIHFDNDEVVVDSTTTTIVERQTAAVER